MLPRRSVCAPRTDSIATLAPRPRQSRVAALNRPLPAAFDANECMRIRIRQRNRLNSGVSAEVPKSREASSDSGAIPDHGGVARPTGLHSPRKRDTIGCVEEFSERGWGHREADPQEESQCMSFGGYSSLRGW